MINPRAWMALAALLLAMTGAYFYLLPGPAAFMKTETAAKGGTTAAKPKAVPRAGTATAGNTRAQPMQARPTPLPPIVDEKAEIASLIARAKPSEETEYQHMSRAIHRLQRKGDALPEDPEEWFEILAEGKLEWEREHIEREAATEIFDRIITQLRLDADSIGPEEFRLYARQFLSPKNSPPWKPGEIFDLTVEAERVFTSLDRDRNGVLSLSETQEPLHTQYDRLDRDGGGLSRAEYFDYFVQRYQEIQDEELGMNEPAAPAHSGKALPKGFPKWFTELDIDDDGQIGLYEWRLAWKAEEFAKLDINQDGYITPEELKQLLEGRKAKDAGPLLNRKLPPEARKAIAAAKKKQ